MSYHMLLRGIIESFFVEGLGKYPTFQKLEGGRRYRAGYLIRHVRLMGKSQRDIILVRIQFMMSGVHSLLIDNLDA